MSRATQSRTSGGRGEMNVNVRRVHGYVSVQVIDGGFTLDLGLLNESERDELAKTLINAAYEIGQLDIGSCSEWFARLVNECGIELPEQEAK